MDGDALERLLGEEAVSPQLRQRRGQFLRAPVFQGNSLGASNLVSEFPHEVRFHRILDNRVAILVDCLEVFLDCGFVHFDRLQVVLTDPGPRCIHCGT